MPLKDHLPLVWFIGTFATPIIYIVCFASKGWVTADDREFGLWEWCFTNFTETTESNMTQCHSIAPGDSPGYYEAVRTIACFTLVAHVVYFFTCNEKEGMGKDKQPCLVSFLSMLGSLTTLAILADHYRDDGPWKDLNPALGWCFWLVVASTVLNFLMIGVSYKRDEIRKSTGSPAVSQAPSNPPPRRASNASTISLDGRRKVTIFHTSTSTPTRGGSNVGGESAGVNNPGPSPSSRQRGEGERFPVLALPRYDMPPLPPLENAPSVAPPSYEEVTRGGAMFPPPPVYSVSEAAARSGAETYG
ncbi:uncharacterized protein LOC143285706 [Babylonia areolata]|uniref:uncharacterized protein LOC143285706 n=1 Tax=Babylonia areolata TaxID=304850 RepID=UPI003FD5029A